MQLLNSLSFDKNEDQPGFGHFEGKIRLTFMVVQYVFRELPQPLTILSRARVWKPCFQNWT